MKYTCPVISVAGINAAREFYEDLFGLEVYQDYGKNIEFICGLALQQDFDGFLSKLREYPDMEYPGEVIEHSWEQRVIPILRFGRTYHRGWQGYENGDKAFSCFWYDYGRSFCKNGRFCGEFNESAE